MTGNSISLRFDDEAAAAAQEVVAKVPGRAACRQEEGRRFIDPDAARRGRAMTSDSRRKEQRSELVQKRRLDTPSSVALVGGGGAACGGRRAAASPALAPRSLRRLRRCAALAMAASCCRASSTSGGADYEYAIAGALMLMHAVEPRACAFPLLELPEELQLLVAGHVVSPRDRAALCVAVPPLGRKAIKEIPTYTGPLMSLGKRVLSGGAVDEAEVRRYVREIAPSEAEHPSLALNECAQLNAIGGRVFCFVTEASNLEWRLGFGGALLRSWKISLTGVTLTHPLHISPGNRNGTPPVQPFAWPARKTFRKRDTDLAVTFRVKSATPTGREMGAANLEDGTSVAALLIRNGSAWVFGV